jgi:protoheme IX farnesyltransferase
MAFVGISRSAASSFGAYLSLTKPRGIPPHFITAAAAMYLAAGGSPPASTLVFTLTGGGLVAAAANTFNSYLDRDIDVLMERTRHRPLPSGKVKPAQALAFGSLLGLAGVLILSVLVNMAAALLAVFALVYYMLPYTLWLKRRTFWGTVIGSGIGALPPLIGWMAVTSRLEPTAFILTAIIILWTLPHFWSLAVFRRSDYKRAGLNVLPRKGAAWWIRACAVLMAAASLWLAAIAGMGVFYLGAATLLGVAFLYLAVRLDDRRPSPTARVFYIFSIIYIASIFIAMIVDCII